MGLKRYRKNVVKRQHKVLHYTEREKHSVIIRMHKAKHVSSSPTEICRGKRNVKLPSNLLPK